MDEPSACLHPPKNNGKEAMTYLTYIIDRYEHLPSMIVLVHSDLQGWPPSWHTDVTDYKNVTSIRRLRSEYVQEHGART